MKARRPIGEATLTFRGGGLRRRVDMRCFVYAKENARPWRALYGVVMGQVLCGHINRALRLTERVLLDGRVVPFNKTCTLRLIRRKFGGAHVKFYFHEYHGLVDMLGERES